MYPSVSRNEFSKFHTLVVSGRRPERKEFREGEHTAIWTKARVKTVDVRASASIRGVSEVDAFVRLLRNPTSSRRSSMTTNKTLRALMGGGEGDGEGEGEGDGAGGGAGTRDHEVAPVLFDICLGISVP